MVPLLVSPGPTYVAIIGWWVGHRLAGWGWSHSYVSELLEWLDGWASLSTWVSQPQGG